MAKRSNMVVFMTLVAIATMSQVSFGQTTHVVGDALGWLVPPGGEVAYQTWAASKIFTVGDVLTFNFTTGLHDVAEVNKAGFDSCNGANPISLITNGPTNITLRSAGELYFICTFTRHCGLGQKLAINVSTASGSPAPQPATPPPAATPSPLVTPPPVTTPSPVATPAPSPSRPPMTYTVGDSLGWLVPPGGAIAYETWARGKDFKVGDVLVFNFTSGAHDVAEVRKAGFDSCSGSGAINTITTSPARITLNTAGQHFYICTFPQHCTLGQKLAINVTGTNAATPSPSTTARPPSSGGPPTQPTPTNPEIPTTPSPVTAPPPPDSSAPSLGVATLPFTFLSIALAFLH